MFQSSYYHFKIKVAIRDLGLYISLKAKENNKHAQNFDIHLMP